MGTSLEVDIGVSDTPYNDRAAQQRRTGKCCCCCCDYRRGVWILDMILLFLSLVSMVYSLAAEQHMVPVGKPGGRAGKDDAQTTEAWDNYVADSAALKFGIVSHGLMAFVFLPLAICGAFKYRWSYLMPVCVWLIFAEIINGILGVKFCQDWDATAEGSQASFDCTPKPVAYVVQVVVLLLILYPHVVFMRQCRRGLMSPDTYETQEMSCCCG